MERIRIVGCVLLVLGLLMTLAGFGYAFTYEPTVEYRYDVKAEQVNDNEMVNESVNYDDLTTAEQEMLYEAFKKSDHFLGGAEATVSTEEPVDGIETGTWNVVRVQGVPMLVAFSGPEEYEAFDGSVMGAVILGTFGLALVLTIAWEAATPSKRRRRY